MIERKFNVSWSTPNAIVVFTIDADILALMKKGGCETLTLAIESGDQAYLNNYIRKRLDLNKVYHLTRVMQKLKIRYNAYFVLGFPNETKE